ncbi:MAG: hypothetical protein SH856_12905 [Flavobacteriales bacterium]|nr:hypothetical protein [Flavobacteriales bacterium]
MSIQQIITEIQLLPIDQRLKVVEETVKSIKQKEIRQQMSLPAESFQEEYKTNKELTAFSKLDFFRPLSLA